MRASCSSVGARCKKLALFCAFLALALPSQAQQYVFRAYRQTQGLNNLAAEVIATDSQGSVWVGTQNGLYRFLGASFQRFGVEQGILEKDINAIVGAPDGTLWVGTDKNLYRWDGLQFQPAAPKPIPTGGTESIAAESPGHLLLVADNHLQRLTYLPDGRFSSLETLFVNRFAAGNPHLEENRVIAIAPDRQVWMACGRLLCNWKDGQLLEWDKQHGVPEQSYYTISFDRKGSIWAVGQSNILELPRGATAFLDRTPSGFLTNQQFVQPPLAVDRSGRVLVATNIGLQRWDGVLWRSFGHLNGIDSMSISSLLFDSNGDLWMGTFGSGVQQWVGYEDWEGWSERQGLPSSAVWSVETNNRQDTAVGTEKGISAIDPHTGLVRPLSSVPWKYGPASSISTGRDGSLLIATVDGVILRTRAGSLLLREVARVKTFIYKIFRDPSGRTFLLNYRHGILDLDEDTPAQEPASIPEVEALLGPSKTIFKACSAPDGSSWFSSRHALLHYDHRQWQRVTVDGLPPDPYQIRGITCAPDGSLWINGKEFGIWKVAPDHGRLKAVELKLPAGATSLAILETLADRRGWLWLATDNGLLVWNGSSWRHLTQESGLIWNDLNQYNLTEDRNGSIWAGTSGGVAHLNHPERIFADDPPRIQMVEIRREDHALSPGVKLRVPWAGRNLSFQFAAPNVLNRDDLVFRYRIAGLQRAWTQTRDATARFSSLPPGNYAFEVYAEDQISGRRSPTLSVPLRILPPWWRTVWAYASYFLSAGLLISLLFRLRMRHLVLQRQRLEALVTERTAQLESSREQLRIQATHDGLTGLLNRSAILDAFTAEIQRAQRENSAVTLVIADLDHFKKVNDTYGHVAGDEALRRFASELAKCTRSYDYAGRYGGEEFMLILTGMDAENAHERLGSLHACITNIEVMEGRSHFIITSSLGAVCLDFSQPQIDAMTLVAAADEALYEAKKTGRNRFVIRGLSSSSNVSEHDIERASELTR